MYKIPYCGVCTCLTDVTGGDLVDKPSATLPDPDELEQRILTDISRMADTDTDDVIHYTTCLLMFYI